MCVKCEKSVFCISTFVLLSLLQMKCNGDLDSKMKYVDFRKYQKTPIQIYFCNKNVKFFRIYLVQISDPFSYFNVFEKLKTS